MISKNDCMLLLIDLEEKGFNTDKQIEQLVRMNEPSLDIIEFINKNRQLDLSRFYEKLRHSYNNKKSSLYINIVKEIEEPNEVLTTLSALLTQALLFSRDLENRDMFLRHARVNDICKILSNYFNNKDLTMCVKLLRIIKADLKALEYFKNKDKKEK